MDTPEICNDEQRRNQVRKRSMNGIDYLEVSEDQLTLTVFFLGKAPEDIRIENVVITGGRRVRDIQVLDVQLCILSDPERDDCMKVTVDKFGDYSTYTLCLVEVDDAGRITGFPMHGFDPRYACIDFSFKVNCPSDLDCQSEPVCPPEERPAPEISYLAKDYASFRRLIYDRLALLMPGWKERHVPDLGVTLVEVLAYAGDHLSYYQDAVATEAYLETARKRISLRRHARLVDYFIHEGCNARAFVFVETSSDLALDSDEVAFLTRFEDAPEYGTVVSPQHLQGLPADSYEVFEPLIAAQVLLYQAHNRIRLYTWGDSECCLPRGATRATLLDEWLGVTPEEQPAPTAQSAQKGAARGAAPQRRLQLRVGDFLLFEEVIGPETGNPADADPTRRHVVRLTRADPVEDPLYPVQVQGYDGEYPTPLVEIEWQEVDALPFPLCISVTGPAPECELLEDVSVARGNIVLVDHGESVPYEDLGAAPGQEVMAPCGDTGCPPDVVNVPTRFRPALQETPLTFGQPPADGAPADLLLRQDPRLALPHISLMSIPPAPGSQQATFTLHDLIDPSDLARAIASQPEAHAYLNSQLSARTLELLEQLRQDMEAGGEGDVPAGLLNFLRRDLRSLLLTWSPRPDLLASQGNDAHFVVEMDEDGRAHLRFGDGDLGRQPQAGSSFITVYRTGNGPGGNLGAEAIQYVLLRKTSLGDASLRPRNPLPAVGGQAPEPMADIRQFAPFAFRSELQRAITAEDYATLAERHPDVQRAAAELRWTGSWYEMRVAVDPLGADEAPQTLLQAVEASLYRYRRIGHDLWVTSARQVPLDITLEVCVLPDFLRGHVKSALLQVFGNRRLPDGQLGFFHPDNLTFGEGVFLSRLVAAAQAVPGVESVSVTQLERLFEGPNQELENGVLPLSPLEVARLDNDPGFPENGQLHLVLRGGR